MPPGAALQGAFMTGRSGLIETSPLHDMSSVFGYAGVRCSHDAAAAEMARASGKAAFAKPCRANAAGYLAVFGLPGGSHDAENGRWQVGWIGHPSCQGTRADSNANEFSGKLLALLKKDPSSAIREVTGDFSIAILDTESGDLTLAVDRVGIRKLAYASVGEGIVFASSLDSIAAHPQVDVDVDQQAVYNYLYFHTVPGPGTIYQSVTRLKPGSYLTLRAGQSSVHQYWHATFDEASLSDRREEMERLVTLLERAVNESATGVSSGAFLSGGVDSSSVVAMLAKHGRPRTFSIGFAESGYDEMAYARIAARAFDAEHHEYYVTADDVSASAEAIASWYDQPFGNSSAVPTYFCARLAKGAGVSRILGGDGGDELFGGNARYAKQDLLSKYYLAPAWARKSLIEPLVLSRPFRSLPYLRKASSYVSQARMELPARYEAHNVLETIGPSQVLTDDFLAAVDVRRPHGLMAELHRPFQGQSLINQMLGIDLRITLDDSDLPKVTGMCALADIDVAFPLLDEKLVAFAAALPAREKLQGNRLRPFFKEAMGNVLPREVISKQKHGFGLPIGVWMNQHARLREMLLDHLAWLAQERIVRKEFVRELTGTLLPAHPAYYGTLAWVLMVLAIWLHGRGRGGGIA